VATETGTGTGTKPERTVEVEGDPFDNPFTRRFGVPVERVQRKVVDHLSEPVRDFIARAPFLVMATADGDGRCDASPKGGLPGFVAVLDERHLLIPDVAGNRLFQSYLNMTENPHVGLIFLIPGSDSTVRVNGRARLVDREEVLRHVAGLSVHWKDDNTVLLQGVLVEVEEAYSHCPRAFRFADLWNPETIAANRV
jgi:PPOX class probable FMN-dependent enzyme